jgi:hypothetical protein
VAVVNELLGGPLAGRQLQVLIDKLVERNDLDATLAERVGIKVVLEARGVEQIERIGGRHHEHSACQ